MTKLALAARIVRKPDSITLDHKTIPEDKDLFSNKELFGVDETRFARKSRNRILSDLDELSRENRWEDMISLYHPVEEKCPELVQNKMDLIVRQRLAFALGQVQQFDMALEMLRYCATRDSENFQVRSSLAYTAYNSLYAARNKEIFLSGPARSQRITLAHENFKKAQTLRPDGVTNYYRQGMLFSQLEKKDKPALELFNRACTNWEALSEKEQSRRQQEKKNYIKSLYRSASLGLKVDSAATAQQRIKKCLEQDEHTNYISLGFKYFALGKVNFFLGHYDKARDALLFSLQSSARKPLDFIHELLAKAYLAQDKKEKAMDTIQKVPERLRKPYYRWTEADILCTLGRYDQAREILIQSATKDNLSKHISLIRLAKIDYTCNNFSGAMNHSGNAVKFYENKWGNLYYEGVFWQALCSFKAGKKDQAEDLVEKLEKECRFYPKLNKLASLIRGIS